MSTIQEIRELVEPLVLAAGFDCEDVQFRQGKPRVLRITVDRDGGVGLDDISDLSRTISQALDTSAAVGNNPYSLEVTSPGIDRPLTLERHWRRNIGRRVKVTRQDGSSLRGKITSAGPDSCEIAADKTYVLPYSDVTKARVQADLKGGQSGH